MHPTKNTLDAAKRGKSVVLLGTGLIHALDLERQAKQAHWNVKGPNFRALHELFDEVAQQAEDASDLLAERMVSLGGSPDGRVATINRIRKHATAARPSTHRCAVGRDRHLRQSGPRGDRPGRRLGRR